MRHLTSAVVSCALALSACASQESPSTESESTASSQLTLATNYPEVVLLETTSADGRQGRCVGTLLASRVVLTVASCTKPAQSFKAVAVNAGGQSAYSTRALALGNATDDTQLAVVLLKTPILLQSYASIGAAALTDNAPAVVVGRRQQPDQIWEGNPVAVRIVNNVFISGIQGNEPAVDNGGAAVFLPGTHVLVGVSMSSARLSIPVQGSEPAVSWVDRLARTDLAKAEGENIVAANLGADVETADCLFNFAERTYPTVFPSPRPATQSAGEYVYRYYEATKTYLGLSNNGKVYTLSEGGQPVEQVVASAKLEEAGCR